MVHDKLKYKRVILKLSGEAYWQGPKESGLDGATLIPLRHSPN